MWLACVSALVMVYLLWISDFAFASRALHTNNLCVRGVVVAVVVVSGSGNRCALFCHPPAKSKLPIKIRTTVNCPIKLPGQAAKLNKIYNTY